jgi:hypothetical protein
MKTIFGLKSCTVMCSRMRALADGILVKLKKKKAVVGVVVGRLGALAGGILVKATNMKKMAFWV